MLLFYDVKCYGAVTAVGLQLYDIVKGQVKIDLSDDTKKNVVMVEEMQQDVNKARQQSRASAKDEEERLKRLFDEPLKNATPEKPAKRKIFIRSRL